MISKQQTASPEATGLEMYTSEAVKGSVYVHPNALGIISDTGRVAMISHDELPTRRLDEDVPRMFGRVSTFHGRSLEDKTGLLLDNTPIVDEFGDTYTEYSIKGAANGVIYADKYDIEPSGVRVNGLMDASTFSRVKTASELLREKGVLTEWPIYFARPKYFPAFHTFKHNLLGLKSKLYNDVLTENLYTEAMDKTAPKIPVGVVGAIGNGLADMEFGVMYRASLSNARLCDIRALESSELDDRLKNAIISLQLRKPDYFLQWENIKDLDPDNTDDRHRYITQILPELIAENVARFHNTNSYHKYLHDGNVTLAGELVDLDSVMMPDEFEDDSEFVRPMSKIHEALDVAHTVAATLARYMLEIKHKASDGTISISSKEMTEYKKQACVDIVLSMHSSYYAVRVLSDDINELEKIILESIFYDHSEIVDELDNLGNPMIIDLRDRNLEEIVVNDMTRFFEMYPDETQTRENFQGYFTRDESTQLYAWAKSQVEARLYELNGNMPVSEHIVKQTINIELIKLLHIIHFEPLENN